MKESRLQRIRKTLAILRERFSELGALDMGSDFQMLVAVVLSARTKDEQVLKALPGLFGAYPNVDACAKATPEEMSAHISRIGLYKSKARYIVALAKKLCDNYGGKVPGTMRELVTLPGVGRKTASVLLTARFSTPAIAVDTHVFRIAQRLGWAKANSVGTLEKKLLRVVPSEVQHEVNITMVPFGRAICISGTPRCWACPVADLCAYMHKNLERPKDAEMILEKAETQRKEIERLKYEPPS
jgi:endonuclease III